MTQTKRDYVRDGRSPSPKSEAVSRVMSANISKNTRPEILLRQALWANGLRGYRLHWKKVPGRPDIAFPGKRIAIFVNGCFWHRCHYCGLPLPKSNRKFWKDKFARNIKRDTMKMQNLRDIGWTVIVVWECQLKKRFPVTVTRIRKYCGT